jgi:hypothetical protein
MTRTLFTVFVFLTSFSHLMNAQNMTNDGCSRIAFHTSYLHCDGLKVTSADYESTKTVSGMVYGLYDISDIKAVNHFRATLGDVGLSDIIDYTPIFMTNGMISFSTSSTGLNKHYNRSTQAASMGSVRTFLKGPNRDSAAYELVITREGQNNVLIEIFNSSSPETLANWIFRNCVYEGVTGYDPLDFRSVRAKF